MFNGLGQSPAGVLGEVRIQKRAIFRRIESESGFRRRTSVVGLAEPCWLVSQPNKRVLIFYAHFRIRTFVSSQKFVKVSSAPLRSRLVPR